MVNYQKEKIILIKMPKSKTNKKRKNKVLAFSQNIKNRQKKFRSEFIKKLQESHNKDLENKVNETSESVINDVNEFGEFALNDDNQPISESSTTESNDLSEFSLDNLPIVEQTEPTPDISGSYSK